MPGVAVPRSAASAFAGALAACRCAAAATCSSQHDRRPEEEVAPLRGQLFPIRVGRVKRKRQAAVGADEDWVLHVRDFAAADLLERGFEGFGQIADQASTAGEDDVVADAFLELRLD